MCRFVPVRSSQTRAWGREFVHVCLGRLGPLVQVGCFGASDTSHLQYPDCTSDAQEEGMRWGFGIPYNYQFQKPSPPTRKFCKFCLSGIFLGFEMQAKDPQKAKIVLRSSDRDCKPMIFLFCWGGLWMVV